MLIFWAAYFPPSPQKGKCNVEEDNDKYGLDGDRGSGWPGYILQFKFAVVGKHHRSGKLVCESDHDALDS
jgi:hypothetical protein